MAITAGGNTLYERIASGTPGISICQFSQQTYIANSFEKMGLNFNIKNHHQSLKLKSKLTIIEFIKSQKIRNNQFKNMQKIKINNGSELLFNKIREVL